MGGRVARVYNRESNKKLFDRQLEGYRGERGVRVKWIIRIQRKWYF
jgi:hypothetical protein